METEPGRQRRRNKRRSRQIKDRIENELTYPGQIKVTVIREMRASETAK